MRGTWRYTASESLGKRSRWMSIGKLHFRSFGRVEIGRKNRATSSAPWQPRGCALCCSTSTSRFARLRCTRQVAPTFQNHTARLPNPWSSLGGRAVGSRPPQSPLAKPSPTGNFRMVRSSYAITVGAGSDALASHRVGQSSSQVLPLIIHWPRAALWASRLTSWPLLHVDAAGALLDAPSNPPRHSRQQASNRQQKTRLLSGLGVVSWGVGTP